MPQLMIPGRLIAAGDDGVLVAGNLLNDATSYLGGVEPYHWADYINNRMLYASADVGTVADGTGYSFTRASEGYYENSDGTLTNFASGALRRGDRGVLIEGARTNLLLRSQEFDNAYWTKASGSISANSTTAPDDTSTADLFTEDTSTGFHRTFSIGVASAASGVTYTSSIFVKPNGRTIVRFVLGGAAMASDRGADFDLTAVTASNINSGTSTITALANGWLMLTVTATTTATGQVLPIIYLASALTTISYTGDGTSGLYLWGAQLEAASFPSSYIPTTSSSATRAADVLTYTAGVSYPLSLWAEFERAVDTGAAAETMAYLDAGDANNRTWLYVSSTDLAAALTSSGGVQQTGLTVAGVLATSTPYKAAVRVSTNSVQMARGGTLGTEDTVATNPTDPTFLRVGHGANLPSFAYIRRIAIFNSALSDANLQTVTT
jgi:hypothetical protein